MAAPPVMGAAPANTFMQSAAVVVHEDLADVIYRIDPEETPFVTSMSRVPSSQTLTEWPVQELNVANAANAQPEGFTATIQAAVPPIRLNNVCQILTRNVGVSNTLRVVDMAGGQDEYNRQLVLRGMELKRDLELITTSPLVRSATDPRKMSGLPAYCSMGNRGAGAGVMPIGNGSDIGTIGTLRDITLDMVNQAMQQVWNAGGKPTLALMSGNIKNYFSTLAQGGTANPIVAQNIVNASPTGQLTIQGAVDIFRTNFGTLNLAPDRFMPAHQVLLITPDYVELAPLPQRDMVQQDYAVTGDNTQGGIVFEGTLRPTAPKAHAWITDLNQ